MMMKMMRILHVYKTLKNNNHLHLHVKLYTNAFGVLKDTQTKKKKKCHNNVNVCFCYNEIYKNN